MSRASGRITLPCYLDDQRIARARMASSLSDLAYDGRDAIMADWGEVAGRNDRFTRLRTLNIGSDTVFVGYYQATREVWVIVRGTDDFQDLLEDFRCSLEPWEGGQAHSGFVEAARRLTGVVQQEVDACVAHGNRAVRVVFTGHSRGGAIAAIVSTMLLTPSCTEVITFGAPRYADAEFFAAPQHRRTLTAYELIRDPITRVPPTVLGYASPEIAQLSKTSVVTRPAYPKVDTKTWRKVLTDVWTICKFMWWCFQPRRLARQIRVRHSMAAYQNTITLLIRNSRQR